MRFFSLAVAMALVGCGTTSSTNNDGGGGDGGCINATEGQSCNASDNACALGGDVCCSGFMQCVSGHWVKEFPGCACQTGTFSCGSATCSTGQICKMQESGVIDGGTSTSCANVPSVCANDQSCACMADSGVCAPTVIRSCTDTQGHVVVDCMGQ
jgi:hypothetical protein